MESEGSSSESNMWITTGCGGSEGLSAASLACFGRDDPVFNYPGN
jgi:hypothetical protein